MKNKAFKIFPFSKKLAFTLIELLIVIAIIGILAGIIIISTTKATDNATLAKAKVFANSLRDSMGNNMVSEWKFDGTTTDGSTATANDLLDTWGTSNGTPYSQPIVKTGSSCINGSCLQFDGVDDYVDFGNNPSLSMGTGNAAVSFWVNFDNTLAPKQETLIHCGAEGIGYGVAGYYLYRKTGLSQIYCNFSDGTTTLSKVALTSSLKGKTWYNIVIVFTRTSIAQAYVNGVKQTGYSLNISSDQASITNSANYRIGAKSVSYYHLAGKMDEFRLYNAAIPTSQIKQQYLTGIHKLLTSGEITKEEHAQRITNLENYSAHK